MPTPDRAIRQRLAPPLTHPARLVLLPLAQRLREAIATLPPTDLRVLDVGCGERPYEPLFGPRAREYVGVDVEPGPHVDVVAPAEHLPLGDAAFDVVLSSQTLEHVPEPAQAIAEMNRVLVPGGTLLLSTHGTAVYHPAPTDLWRWTQEGLEKVVRENGNWSSVQIRGAGGTVACLGRLIAFYVDAGLSRRPLAPMRMAIVALVNAVFGALDPLVPLHHPRPHTLIPNFLVVARKT